MHVYKQANFRLYKAYRKWLVELLVKAPATSHKWPSYIRGYHKYESAWLPTIARETLWLTTELTNLQDPFAVAMMKYSCDKIRQCSGKHSRDNQSDSLLFPRKYGSICFCEVTGVMINHATGFGLKILCVYCFYGH